MRAEAQGSRRTVAVHAFRVLSRPLDDSDARNVAFIFREQSHKMPLLSAALAAFKQTVAFR